MIRPMGLLAIVGLQLLLAGLYLGFMPDRPPEGVLTINLLGGFAFVSMSVSMILSTRLPFLEDAFGGLDRVYQVHKYSGILAVLAVVAHFLLQPDNLASMVQGGEDALRPSGPVGTYAMVFLLLGTMIALNRKVRYSRWHPTHKVMAVVYVLATVHIVTMPGAFLDLNTPAGYFIVVLGSLGLLSGIYALFVMNRLTALSFTVEKVSRLERTTELVLKPDRQMPAFRPGQFVFVELRGKGWSEPHPFTIASAPQEDRLRLAVKALGDWTRKLREELEPGGKAIVRGPYGRFDTLRSGAKQVWVAGGIGVTPFLSNLRAMRARDLREVHLFYAVRSLRDALYLDEISRRAEELPNLTLTVLNSETGQRASLETIAAALPCPVAEFAFFMCGPDGMTASLRKQLGLRGVRRRNIHLEAFEFR